MRSPGSTLLGRGSHAAIPMADVKAPDLPIEEGASLRVLRPAKFVARRRGGLPRQHQAVRRGDRRRRARRLRRLGGSAAADRGRRQYRRRSRHRRRPGPTIRTSSPTRLVDLDRHRRPISARSMAAGGRWSRSTARDIRNGAWIAMPMGASGGPRRLSQVLGQGGRLRRGPGRYRRLPRALPGKLKATGHPLGLRARQRGGRRQRLVQLGDVGAWRLHGRRAGQGHHQQQGNHRGAEIRQGALRRPSSPARCPGSTPTTTRRSLAGEIGLTQNGISLYYSIKNSQDAEDQGDRRGHLACAHADRPGRQADRARPGRQRHDLQAHANIRTPPRSILRFMMEKEQYDPWLNGLHRLLEPSAAGLRASAVWTGDPKHEPYKDVLQGSRLWHGYKGSHRRGLGGGARRLRAGADGARRYAPARRRRRRPPPKPSAAPSVTTGPDVTGG